MININNKTNNINKFKEIQRIYKLVKELNSKENLKDKRKKGKVKVKVKAKIKIKIIYRKELILGRGDNKIL